MLRGARGVCRVLRASPLGRFHCKRVPAFHHSAASVAEASTASTPTTADVAPPPFKAMLDFKFMKDNVPLLEKNCRDRNVTASPQRVADLYDQYLQLKLATDELRNERNANAKEMKGKLDPEKRQALVTRGQQLKASLETLEAKLATTEDALQVEGQRIPNTIHPDAPIGGEDQAAVRRLVGEQRTFTFDPKDHVAIAEALDLVDFQAASEVSGSKFYYLKNAAALLEMALVNWAMQKVVGRGFTPLMTPDIVKASVLEKCGFQPRANNTQVYSIQDTGLCLTGTAEVPLAGLYMDQVLSEAQLPIRLAAFGHCFRTEAGAAGAAGRGLYRVHQFSKVEMFVLSTPEQSDALHEELILLEEEMFAELGLHFQVLDMPSGDLGAPAHRKYDVEAWMPGLQRYGEISSASNCTDFQSRRLNIRYRPAASKEEEGGGKKGVAKKGKTVYVHTLNATACAVPRLIVAILENFQQEDGSVAIPAVLRPYLGGMEAIPAPSSS